MRCPKCQHKKNRVIDSRARYAGTQVRRRYRCAKCQHRWTTIERQAGQELDIPAALTTFRNSVGRAVLDLQQKVGGSVDQERALGAVPKTQ